MNLQQIKKKLLQSKAGVEADRNKKMLVLMPVLFVIFIFMIARAIKQPSSCSAVVSNLSVPKAACPGSVESCSAKINWQIPDLYPTQLRDPMQGDQSAAGFDEGGVIIVKGIMYSKNRPSAVIDDRIMHQGDKISGAVIVKINKKNVEFEMGEKKWTQEVQR